MNESIPPNEDDAALTIQRLYRSKAASHDHIALATNETDAGFSPPPNAAEDSDEGEPSEKDVERADERQKLIELMALEYDDEEEDLDKSKVEHNRGSEVTEVRSNVSEAKYDSMVLNRDVYEELPDETEEEEKKKAKPGRCGCCGGGGGRGPSSAGRKKSLAVVMAAIVIVAVGITAAVVVTNSSKDDDDDKKPTKPPVVDNYIILSETVDLDSNQAYAYPNFIVEGEYMSMSADGGRVTMAVRHNASGTDMYHVFQYNTADKGFSDIGHITPDQPTNDTLPTNDTATESSRNLAESDVNPLAMDMSGDGTRLAFGFTQPSSDNYGQVSVFGLENGNWDQLGSNIKGSFEQDYTGSSLSFSHNGSHLVIGSPNYMSGMGMASIYTFNQTEDLWQLGKDLIDESNEGGNMGNSISLSSNGKVLAVAAHKSSTEVQDAGSVHFYTLTTTNNTSQWQSHSTLNGDENNFFGTNVVLSSDGQRIAISSKASTSSLPNSGSCEVYHLHNATWEKLGSILKGDQEDAQFAHRISFSGDGNRLAVSIGTPPSVRVYQLENGDWTQLGPDVTMEKTKNFGQKIKLSQDGGMLAVSAVKDDEKPRGIIYIYTVNNSTDAS